MSRSLPWIDDQTPLPDARTALLEPSGLVAAGLDLSPDRLDEAYRKGIFPWFSDGQPVLWWSPDPRMVLQTDRTHISKSLRKRLRQIERAQRRGDFSVVVTTDVAFDDVMMGCATRGREDSQQDTWITPPMVEVYRQWHQMGRVHSVETWQDGMLVGGLYGVCIGKMFFGESMFSRAPDASKLALVHLAAFLHRNGVNLIDCQMQTNHLSSMGAVSIERETFLQHVELTVRMTDFPWQPGWLNQTGHCHPLLQEASQITAQPGTSVYASPYASLYAADKSAGQSPVKVIPLDKLDR